MGSTFLIVMMLMQAQPRAEPEQPLAVLSVCDVVTHDPTRRNGQVVKVRGVLAGTNEGIWLVDECPTHLVTKGLSWGNDLSVHVNAADRSIERSWEAMLERVKQLHESVRDKVWITILGRVETRASMDDEVVQMPYGLRRAGFGHLGEAPAEIDVILVEDVSVERRLAIK
jgi:hypothetical protein